MMQKKEHPDYKPKLSRKLLHVAAEVVDKALQADPADQPNAVFRVVQAAGRKVVVDQDRTMVIGSLVIR